VTPHIVLDFGKPALGSLFHFAVYFLYFNSKCFTRKLVRKMYELRGYLWSWHWGRGEGSKARGEIAFTQL